MIVGPQDALGALYSFVLLICPPKHHACLWTDPAAIVRREDGLGQFSCEAKVASVSDRMTPALKGRVVARCEFHEANRV